MGTVFIPILTASLGFLESMFNILAKLPGFQFLEAWAKAQAKEGSVPVGADTDAETKTKLASPLPPAVLKPQFKIDAQFQMPDGTWEKIRADFAAVYAENRFLNATQS